MIEYVTGGDLLAAECEALVNSVNCVGVMGRGVALAFKRRFPANFKAYKAACDWGELEPGRMFVFETDELMPRYVIKLSDQAALARPEPPRRHRDRVVSAGDRDRAARNSLDRPAAAWLRAGRSRLEGRETAHPWSARGPVQPGYAGVRTALE